MFNKILQTVWHAAIAGFLSGIGGYAGGAQLKALLYAGLGGAIGAIRSLWTNRPGTQKGTQVKPDSHTASFLLVIMLITSALVFCLPVSTYAQTSSSSSAPAAPSTPSSDCSQAAIAAGTAEANCGIKFRAETNFYQLSNGKQATQVSAIIPLTPRFAAVASQFFIPTAQGQITAVGPQFDEKLSHILGKKSANVTGALLNASKITLYGRLLLGSEVNSLTNQRAFAGVLEGGARFPIANVSGVIVQARVGAAFIFVPHYDAPPERFFLGSNNAAATLGLNASF